MSNNLECEGIELAQTPTHITRKGWKWERVE